MKMGDDDDDEYDPREQIFHNTVREYIIFLLLFLILYLLSYVIVSRFKKKDHDDYFSADEEEATVYKVSLYLCVFALSVAICAALLLPISIVSNEILLLYPKSYYVKWLNHSLIQGIWNLVFLFSNVSLFALLPFAYLFTESEGLIGQRRGVKSRVLETFIVLFLLAMTMFGLTFVVNAMIDTSRSSFETFRNFWSYYLPFLYSCMSFLGVVTLLVCTPLGLSRLFGIVSRALVKPQFLQNIDEEYYIAVFEEDLLKRRLRHTIQTGNSYASPKPMTPYNCIPSSDVELIGLQNGALQTGLAEKLAQIEQIRSSLERQRATSKFRGYCIYPFAMASLVAITFFTIIFVTYNTIQLVSGFQTLPPTESQFIVGLTSISILGPVGAGIEIVIIIYLAVTSCVGLYTMPVVSSIRPKVQKTSLSSLIANCGLLLILSSALPVLSRTLGITNFNLLGDFGKIEWLGNFQIVMAYNLIFAAVTGLCLVRKVTTPGKRFKTWLLTYFNKQVHSRNTMRAKEE